MKIKKQYTSGKKKLSIFRIAVYIEECEGNAKLLLHSWILTHSLIKMLKLVIK